MKVNELGELMHPDNNKESVQGVYTTETNIQYIHKSNINIFAKDIDYLFFSTELPF